jgi:hypothetical protein
MRRSSGRISDERGQAATELVIILPVFLALVFGLIQLGKGFAYWVDMTHLAGEGSRYASVSWFPGCSSDSTQTGTCGGLTLQNYVSGQTDTQQLQTGGDNEVPNALSVTYCYPPQGTGVTAGQPGSALRVNIHSTYRLSLVNAALGLLPGGSGLGDVNLNAHSTVRLERPIDLARLGVGSIPNC